MLGAALQQVEGNIAAALGSLGDGAGAATLAGETQLADALGQGLAALDGVTRSSDEQAAATAGGHGKAMAAIAGTDNFAEQRSGFTRQTTEAAAAGSAALAKAVDGMRKGCAATTKASAETLKKAHADLEQNLRGSKQGIECDIVRQADEAASHEAPAWKRLVAVLLVILVIVIVIAVIVATGGAAMAALVAAAGPIGAGIIVGAAVGAVTSGLLAVAGNLWSNRSWSQGVGQAMLEGAITGAIGGGLGAAAGLATRTASVAVRLGAQLVVAGGVNTGVQLFHSGGSFENFSFGQLGFTLVVTALSFGLAHRLAAPPAGGAATKPAPGALPEPVPGAPARTAPGALPEPVPGTPARTGGPARCPSRCPARRPTTTRCPCRAAPPTTTWCRCGPPAGRSRRSVPRAAAAGARRRRRLVPGHLAAEDQPGSRADAGRRPACRPRAAAGAGARAGHRLRRRRRRPAPRRSSSRCRCPSRRRCRRPSRADAGADAEADTVPTPEPVPTPTPTPKPTPTPAPKPLPPPIPVPPPPQPEPVPHADADADADADAAAARRCRCRNLSRSPNRSPRNPSRRRLRRDRPLPFTGTSRSSCMRPCSTCRTPCRHRTLDRDDGPTIDCLSPAQGHRLRRGWACRLAGGRPHRSSSFLRRARHAVAGGINRLLDRLGTDRTGFDAEHAATSSCAAHLRPFRNLWPARTGTALARHAAARLQIAGCDVCVHIGRPVRFARPA